MGSVSSLVEGGNFRTHTRTYLSISACAIKAQHNNENSTLYRSLVLLSFVFVKPISSTVDPTHTSRIIIHSCCLDITL